MIKKNRSSMNVRKRSLPAKKRKIQGYSKIKTNRELDSHSPAKTGKKQIILGKARGIDGRKHKHGGLVGRGIFQIPGQKGSPME